MKKRSSVDTKRQGDKDGVSWPPAVLNKSTVGLRIIQIVFICLMLIFQASPGAQTFHWPQLALSTTLHTWDDLGRSMQIHISQQISQITEPEEQQAGDKIGEDSLCCKRQFNVRSWFWLLQSCEEGTLEPRWEIFLASSIFIFSVTFYLYQLSADQPGMVIQFWNPKDKISGSNRSQNFQM